MHTINMLAPKDVISRRWTRRLRFALSYLLDSSPENIARIRRAMVVHGG